MKLDLKTNWLDRAIAFVAPQWGLERQRDRAMMALSGSYIGGGVSTRPMSTYMPGDSSADGAVVGDLPLLRQRSRDLMRNNALALGAINTTVTNVVGGGLKLKCQVDRKILGMTDESAEAWQSQVEAEFALWAETQNCDVTRTLDFYSLQELAFRSTLESGDVFCLLPFVERKGDIYGLKLQLIEADLCTNKNWEPDSSTLTQGVQLDNTSAPVAYHFLKYHPASYKLEEYAPEWRIVPAFGRQTGRRNVIHLFRRLRPGQTRGVPHLAPVIEPLKQLGRYTDAEIMAAVISGMFTVFVKSEGGEGLAPMLAAGTSDDTANDIRLGNGAIVDLRPGEDISTANPGRPSTAFDPFVQAILRQVGVALELPFEILIKHFTASYSAARAALLEAWRFFSNRRNWLARNFCQVVYEAWLEEAIARGRVSAPGFADDPVKRRAYLCARWYGDSPGQIDPVKEVTAAKLRVDMGVSTLSEETAALTGNDWESVHRQQVIEQKLRVKDGLMLDPTEPPPVAPVPGGDKPPAKKPSKPAKTGAGAEFVRVDMA